MAEAATNPRAELKKRILRRGQGLITQRSSWLTDWMDVSAYLAPRLGRWFPTDTNRGGRKSQLIYDRTAARGLRVLSAGLMSGMTSPARPWFRLTTRDPDLAKSGPVKLWLALVGERMRDIFTHSNTYRGLHSMYKQLGTFGVSCSLVLEDFEDVIRFYTMEAGEFCLAANARNVVDTVYRELQMTQAQLVEQFGAKACSARIQADLREGRNLDQWITISHMIEPRRVRTIGAPDARNMPFASYWIEQGRDVEDEIFLRESGYKRFPALAVRWEPTGNDVYGDSPGLEGLGDIKQLQHQQLRKSQGIDYKTKPSMQTAAANKNRDIDLLPGGISFLDSMGDKEGLRPTFQAEHLDLRDLREDIQDVRQRISDCFYEPLFMMMANDERAQPATAREIAERHEEKLLMLGPVLERFHDEMLAPLIDITFDRMMDAKLVPPPPDELQGQDLKIEFVSVLAQAQRAVGLQAVDRFLGTVGNMSALWPNAKDKVKVDNVIDRYGEYLGMDPELIASDEEVAAVREQRAKAAEQAAQQEQMAQQAETAQKLAATPTGGQNALTDLMSQFQGYGLPQQ